MKLARGDLVALDRAALAVKRAHILEEAEGDFWRQFERFAARSFHPAHARPCRHRRRGDRRPCTAFEALVH
jgi:hypothetical protein